MRTLARYIKMTIKLKDGRKVIAYFENLPELKIFDAFIKELIAAVRTKAKGETEE